MGKRATKEAPKVGWRKIGVGLTESTSDTKERSRKPIQKREVLTNTPRRGWVVKEPEVTQ